MEILPFYRCLRYFFIAHMALSSQCLTDDRVLALASTCYPRAPDPHVERHLDRCRRCRLLVAGAVRKTGELDRQACWESTLAPGVVLASRFEVRRLIGSGGMGEVYEALDARDNRVVALKTLAWPFVGLDFAAVRLLEEAKLAGRIDHPNVCRVRHIGLARSSRRPSELPFFTMDLLMGETLGQRLRRGRAPDRRSVAILLDQLAAGLEAIQRAGVVHGDFKSDNVLLTPQPAGVDRAVVMDLGLATCLDEARDAAERPRVLGGTPGYMAPEQAAGARPTPAFDVFAFGIVAWEILTGRMRSAESTEDLSSVGKRFVAGLAFEAPLRQPAWADLIVRCLEPDSVRRPADMTVVRREMAALITPEDASTWASAA